MEALKKALGGIAGVVSGAPTGYTPYVPAPAPTAGGGTDTNNPASTAFADAMKAMLAETKKFGDDLAHLGDTTYQAAIRSITDAGTAKLAEMLAMDGAVAASATAAVSAWEAAQIAILEAQNKIKATAITDDIAKQIKQLGMTDLEKQIADVNDKASDYLKSLQDIGQTTAENTAQVEAWRKAMLGVIAAKESVDAMKKIVEAMDAIKSFSADLGNTIDTLRAAAPGFDAVADSASKLAVAWANLNAAKPSDIAAKPGTVPTDGVSVQDRIALAGKLKDAILANYNAELAALQKNQGERMKALTDQQAKEKEVLDKNLTSIKVMSDAFQALGEYAKSMVLGALSILSPTQKLQESRAQYDATLAAAKGGDATAAGKLQAIAEEALKANQSVNASSPAYAEFFRKVLADMQGFGGMSPDKKADAEKAQAASDAATKRWQDEVAALQKVFDAETLALQNKSIAELQKLSAITDTWQTELNHELQEQAIIFSRIGLSSAEIAKNTEGLDTRIASAIAAAGAAHDAVGSIVSSVNYQEPISTPRYSQDRSDSSGGNSSSSNEDAVKEAKLQTTALNEVKQLISQLIDKVAKSSDQGLVDSREIKQTLVQVGAKIEGAMVRATQ